jgi:hypothetical protein
MRASAETVKPSTVRAVRRGAAVTVAALVVLAGCSSTDDSDAANAGTSEATTTTTASTTTVATSDPAATSSPADAPSALTPAAEADAPTVLDPVALDQSADLGNGLRARLSALESVDGKATIPGEISGAAVLATIEVTNTSGAAVQLGSVTVDMTDAAGLPVSQITTEPAQPFAGTLEAGQSATARYLFTLAPEDRSSVVLTVALSPTLPIMTFTGSMSDV